MHAPAGTKKLFKLMLGTDSEFVNKFFQARKYWDINVGQWVASGTAAWVSFDAVYIVTAPTCHKAHDGAVLPHVILTHLRGPQLLHLLVLPSPFEPYNHLCFTVLL